MIDSKELRIGNLVKVYEEGNIVEVIKIAENNLEVHSKDLQFWDIEIEEAEGIPLSEEWLLKLGLEKEFDRIDYVIKGLSIYVNQNNEFETYYEIEYILNLQYVHQLQNLYFALTGEELTLKN